MRPLVLVLLSWTALGADLALTGARIYSAADEATIPDGTLVFKGERILALGPRKDVRLPIGVKVVDCTGLTLVPGFWNSHVHLTEPKWENAAAIPADRLEQQLEEMFSRYGFTTVFDTGSFAPNTNAIRTRVRTGEVRGPLILTAGAPIAPKGGSPYYLEPVRLPEIESPGQAPAMVRERVESGSDAIKIFTASWATRQRVVPMPLENVRAISEEAHRLGRLVIAHPSDMTGLEAAIDGGVDVLAHTIENIEGVAPNVLRRMRSRGMSLIPTLTLFREETGFSQVILKQVTDYSAIGGQILLGTDAGYLPVYDPALELRLLAQAGLDYRKLLAVLTAAPAQRYGFAGRKGRLAAGMDADIVALEEDPAAGAAAFSKVRYVFREGVMLYSSRMRKDGHRYPRPPVMQ